MTWRIEMKEALAAARAKDRRGIFKYYQEKAGYSTQSLYRIAKEHGFMGNKKERSDKGELDCELTDDQVEYVAALVRTSAREKKGPIMPVEDALEIATDNGIINCGQISAARISQVLRERQINAAAMRAPRPHTEMRSLHPNHVHVVDASVCVQYYLKNGRTGLIDERDYYKNKPQNIEKIKTRLLRYLLVDHFSGCLFPWYFETTGETKENLYNFLVKAWGKKNNEKYPFRGVPYVLLMDRGSANTSNAIVTLLRDRLGINIPEGLPYNPQRQGSVESMHNIWERHFESRLAFHPAWGMDELNDWSQDYAAYFNAIKKHSRHEMTRTSSWMLIKQNELRELPHEDILKDLFREPEKECTVDGTYTISFRGKEYGLKFIEGLFRGAKVKAILKPFAWPRIEVSYREKRYEAEPLADRLPASLGGFRADAAIIGLEYKAQPETLTQKAAKRFDNMAYGDERKKDAIPFEGIKVFGIHADKIGNLAYIDKKGTMIEVDRKILKRHISFIEFLSRLKTVIGPISPEMNKRLREEHGDSIEASRAEELIREAAGGGQEGALDEGPAREAAG